MKTPLKISLAANLCLAVLVLLLAQGLRIGGGEKPQNRDLPSYSLVESNPFIPAFSPSGREGAEREGNAPLATVSSPSTPRIEGAEVTGRADGRGSWKGGEAERQSENKFNWGQLESPDYRTFIANLAAIGCPRQTIRDIITADVDSLYATRRAQLANQREKLQALSSEEASVLNDLLGSQVGASLSARNTSPAPTRSRRQQNQDGAVAMPLVFQAVDPAALQLSQNQQADVAYLRYQFQKEIGGPNADPKDPAYRERWQAAQPQNDLMLHAMLGTRVYESIRDAGENRTAAK